MAIPSYAYLKLKIPRPSGVITEEAKTQRALDYERTSIELATAVVAAAELREMCLHVPPTSTGLAMLSSSGAFKAVEDAKVVPFNAQDPTKTIQIGASLNPK
jgi:hypothetical protein